VRVQRVTTPDGRVWFVRRRWARRQLRWRRPDYELSPVERDEVPVLPPGLVAAVAGAVLVVERVVPFLVGNALPIGARLFALAAVVLADRLTRPWFIEAESGRLVDPPRRIWRVCGWRRARRAFRAVVDAVAEGRIDSRYGVIAFTDRSAAP
jgi:hypothetical protein